MLKKEAIFFCYCLLEKSFVYISMKISRDNIRKKFKGSSFREYLKIFIRSRTGIPTQTKW